MYKGRQISNVLNLYSEICVSTFSERPVVTQAVELVTLFYYRP